MVDVDLTKIGLNKNEQAVYLTLVRLKSGTVKDIVDASGIYRRTIYDALETLQQKGLVSFAILNKKMVFKADPKNLLYSLKDKENYVKSIIPKLLKIQPKQISKPQVEIFSGKKGWRTVIEEQVSSDFFAIGMGIKAWKILKYSLPQIVKKLKKRKNKGRILAHEIARPLYKKLRKEFPIWRGEIRYLSKEYFAPSTTMIWNNKISISLHQEPPFIVVIENKEIAKAYINYFKLLWQIAKP